MDRFVFRSPDGLSLVGDRGGNPAAPAVIFLHGGGQTRHSWKRGVQRMVEAGYQAFSLDARGHGESDWAANGDYSNAARAADLRALIEIVPGRPVLVGASLGGMTSLSVLGEDPELAAALVLVDVTPHISARGAGRILAFMRQAPDGFASLEQAADAIASYNPARPRPSDLSGLKRNLRRQGDRWHWHWDPRCIPADAKPEQQAGPMVAAASRITIPTLLVRGSESDVVGDEQVAQFRELMPHAEYVDIAGAGHMVAGDRNDHFNDAILSFICRTVPLQACRSPA